LIPKKGLDDTSLAVVVSVDEDGNPPRKEEISAAEFISPNAINETAFSVECLENKDKESVDEKN
jgi:hypothetical protein